MGADVETDSHGTLSCVLWQRKELGGAESSKEGNRNSAGDGHQDSFTRGKSIEWVLKDEQEFPRTRLCHARNAWPYPGR